MRNYLLAGTSAVALALSAGAATAQTAPGKFDIKISGDAYFEAGFVGQDKQAGTGVTEFTNRFRLVVTPVAKADNGITYGGRVRIRANAADGTLDGDRAYIFVEGNFGHIRAGVTNGVSDDTYVAAPTEWQGFEHWDQWRRFVGNNSVNATSGAAVGYANGAASTSLSGTTLSTSTAGEGVAVTKPGTVNAYAWGQFGSNSGTEGTSLLRSSNVDTKVAYYTPRFLGQSPTSGLQGAVSYTPRNDATSGTFGSVNTNVARERYDGGATKTTLDTVTGVLTTTSTSLVRSAFDDVYEITANYNETFNGVLVKASAGYSGGTAVNDGPGGNVNKYHDLETFQAGLQVGYAGFVVGGGFVWGGKSGYTKAPFVNATGTAKSATTGVTTKLEDLTAWSVGGQYTWGPLVVGLKYAEQTDAGNLAVAGDRTLGALTLGALYTVAPGLRTGVEYTHFHDGSDVVGGSDEGNVVLLRTQLTF